MSIETSCKNLYKKMDATSKTRFYASRRLKMHEKLSTYTVVIISLAIIFISLMQAFDLGVNIQSKYSNLIQSFAGIAVLVYSLVIDKNGYSLLSDKMYSCASAVGELKQIMHPYKDGEGVTQEMYAKFQKDYWDILKLYETHTSNDFSGDNWCARLDMSEDYSIKGLEWWKCKFKIWRAHALNFISYPLVLLPLVWSISWIWFGSTWPIP